MIGWFISLLLLSGQTRSHTRAEIIKSQFADKGMKAPLVSSFLVWWACRDKNWGAVDNGQWGQVTGTCKWMGAGTTSSCSCLLFTQPLASNVAVTSQWVDYSKLCLAKQHSTQTSHGLWQTQNNAIVYTMKKKYYQDYNIIIGMSISGCGFCEQALGWCLIGVQSVVCMWPFEPSFYGEEICLVNTVTHNWHKRIGFLCTTVKILQSAVSHLHDPMSQNRLCSETWDTYTVPYVCIILLGHPYMYTCTFGSAFLLLGRLTNSNPHTNFVRFRVW